MIRSQTVCFTGHRPNKLGGYDESNPLFTQVKRRLAEEIHAAITAGYTTFISGMALGVDMAAAEIVLSVRETAEAPVKLITAVPFDGQERNWPESSQRNWRGILTFADEVVYVCEPGYAAWKMQRRNEWMVDNSALVIAVWDGTPGGTANCVRYAEKAAHKPRIVQINPKELT